MTGSTFWPISIDRHGVVGLQIIPTFIAINRQIQSVEPTRGISASTRAMRVRDNPKRAEGIRQGRMRLAKIGALQNNGAVNLAALRLAAGLSQAELAERIEMLQPNLARLEKKPGDPTASTLKKLAAVLNVDFPTLLSAIDVSNRAQKS